VVSRCKRVLHRALSLFLWVVGVVMVMGIFLRDVRHDWYGLIKGLPKKILQFCNASTPTVSFKLMWRTFESILARL